MVTRRLKAVWDLMVPEIREFAGVHDYDGVIQDLSPSGVAACLGALGPRHEDERLADRHDEDHLAATEAMLRADFELVEVHRWNPIVHLANLDLACYDREYASEADRAAGRAAHLEQWPAVIEGALESLDSVPAPVAGALVGAIAGLADDIEPGHELALAAHRRLLAHIEEAAANGSPDAALGSAALCRLLGDSEGMSVDLGRLEERADAERNRLQARLQEECDRLEPGRPPREVIAELVKDHPDDEGIYAAARGLIQEISAFMADHELLPELGGECQVGPAPPSRRFVVAMMSWTGAYEADAPAWFYVNPPDTSWDDEAKDHWRSMFSATTLPAITAHEVTPGHFAHGRMLRQRARGDIRRSLYSPAFVEGWAHYGEELMVEAGFRGSDPRFALGVWIEALLRVTRLAAALGVHRGTMTMDEATKRFEEDAFLLGPAARSEATRATFDPTYGRYTWGKLEIMALRDEAIATWGSRYSLLRFHEALLDLGAPVLGTMGDAIEP